jgi:serine/threonine-protein kinase
VQATTTAGDTPAQPPESVLAGGSPDPELACKDRILLGYQICMGEQCAKPLYAGHPVCQQRQAAAQARKQQQANRN